MRIVRRLSAAAALKPTMRGLRPGLQSRAGIRPARLLAALSAALILTAAAVCFFIYREGDTARRNADSLMEQYIQARSASQPAASSALPSAQLPAPGETAGNYVQPDAPEAEPSETQINVNGYDVIGVLEIDTIGLKLPVISKTTDKALKVSVCWYSGALPGEAGNMVITGHNYANGAHFGKLGKLKAGDTVTFQSAGGASIQYRVYATQSVSPDDTASLERCDGDCALTLLTCRSAGNQRLLVRCKALS